jgi:hypothetical protein
MAEANANPEREWPRTLSRKGIADTMTKTEDNSHGSQDSLDSLIHRLDESHRLHRERFDEGLVTVKELEMLFRSRHPEVITPAEFSLLRKAFSDTIANMRQMDTLIESYHECVVRQAARKPAS